MVNLLPWPEIEEKLRRAFAPEQAASLVEVLATFHQMEMERAADTCELKQGLAALTEEVGKLTAAQARTEAHVANLRVCLKSRPSARSRGAVPLAKGDYRGSKSAF